MKMTHWAFGAVAVLTLNLSIGSAQAAPNGVAVYLKAAVGQTSSAEKVHSRCWWHRGHRHCRRYVRHYRYYAAPYYPYYYAPRYYGAPYAYGYGPGIGLFFGGGHHHHHHHHGHH